MTDIEKQRAAVAAYDAQQREEGLAKLRAIVGKPAWAQVRDALAEAAPFFAQSPQIKLSIDLMPGVMDRLAKAAEVPAG